jgi:hypothetical protein
MNLILWRHADAEDLPERLVEHHPADLQRRLTQRGHKQAERVGQWLIERLDADALILVSPALRAQETAAALKREFETVRDIAPGADASAVLAGLAGWPCGHGRHRRPPAHAWLRRKPAARGSRSTVEHQEGRSLVVFEPQARRRGPGGPSRRDQSGSRLGKQAPGAIARMSSHGFMRVSMTRCGTGDFTRSLMGTPCVRSPQASRMAFHAYNTHFRSSCVEKCPPCNALRPPNFCRGSPDIARPGCSMTNRLRHRVDSRIRHAFFMET